MSIILASALSHLYFHRYTVEQSEHEIFVGPSQAPLLYWLIVLTMAGISQKNTPFTPPPTHTVDNILNVSVWTYYCRLCKKDKT